MSTVTAADQYAQRFDTDSITFEPSALLEALKCARVWSSHPKDERFNLEGVRLERVFPKDGDPSKSYVCMVATDGTGLWVRGLPPYSVDGKVHAVGLSRDDVIAIIGMLRVKPGPVVFSFSHGSHLVKIGRTTRELEGLGGCFPPWRKFVPKPTNKARQSRTILAQQNLLKVCKSLQTKTTSFGISIEMSADPLGPVTVRGTVAGEPTCVILMPMRCEYDAYGSPK